MVVKWPTCSNARFVSDLSLIQIKFISNLLGQALNCMACSGEGQECKDADDVGSTQNCKSDETW